MQYLVVDVQFAHLGLHLLPLLGLQLLVLLLDHGKEELTSRQTKEVEFGTQQAEAQRSPRPAPLYRREWHGVCKLPQQSDAQGIKDDQ